MADREFLRRCENICRNCCLVGECLLAIFDRPFFNKIDILKQKKIAGNERVRKNLKYAEGKGLKG
jgi:hypothetical protein